MNLYGNPNDVMMNSFISIAAFVVSVIALILALLTYFSIDSVNTKSTLEGNVLENEAYTISIVSKFRQYKEYEDDVEIMEKVFKEQHRVLRKKEVTNIQVADALQMLIDDYAIIGNCNQRKDIFPKLAEKTLDLMEKRIVKLRDYSNGLQHVVEENRKMIRYLYSGKFSREDLDEIRGDLFLNPYTRYLYFDSVGRQYYWSILPKEVKDSGYGLLTLEGYRRAKNHALNLSEEEKFIMKLQIDKSLEAMRCANDIPIYNKPYTVYINDFMFRLSILQSIYLGIDTVEESYQKNKCDWVNLKMQLGIDYHDMNKSFLWTAVFKSYYRMFLSYHAYCAVFYKLPVTWLKEMDEFIQCYKEGNMSKYETLMDLTPCIRDYNDMLKIYNDTYKDV